METMQKMEGACLPSPTRIQVILPPLSCPLWQLSYWTWVRFSENVGKKTCNASPNVLFNIFNKMNSYLVILMCPVLLKFCT